MNSKQSACFYVLSLLLAWCVGNTPAAAATFHVAAGGNDSNLGTMAQPWTTLQHAANVVGPGDREVRLQLRSTPSSSEQSHSGGC
jgi:hypothetical protein